jgi:hypothetical protein
MKNFTFVGTLTLFFLASTSAFSMGQKPLPPTPDATNILNEYIYGEDNGDSNLGQTSISANMPNGNQSLKIGVYGCETATASQDQGERTCAEDVAMRNLSLIDTFSQDVLTVTADSKGWFSSQYPITITTKSGKTYYGSVSLDCSKSSLTDNLGNDISNGLAITDCKTDWDDSDETFHVMTVLDSDKKTKLLELDIFSASF